MLTWPRVIAVGEVMDYIGVIRGDSRMMGIVQAGHDAEVTIQGHAPLLEGRELNAYLASGARDDHEMMLGHITEQKLRLGMLPFLRNATGANTIPDVLPSLMDKPFLEVAFCTDDIVPADLLENGHLDRGIREAIRLGVDPALAVRWATIVSAKHYKLREHGAIAPGYLADIILLDSLEDVKASEVIVGGKLVVEGGKLIKPIKEPPSSVNVESSVRIQGLDEQAFKMKTPIDDGDVDVNVMLFSDDFLVRAEVESANVVAGEIVLDSISPDACFLSVVPRHGQSHPPSLAIMRGLGLQSGAMAGTISHDCHNIVVAGRTASDMLFAVQQLEETGGGIVLVENGRALASIELPVAGLMSWNPAKDVAIESNQFNMIAREKGITFHSPMWALSFLALAVIPEVRITDFGMIDVLTQEFMPVFP
jgi:adenine deaminase